MAWLPNRYIVVSITIFVNTLLITIDNPKRFFQYKPQFNANEEKTSIESRANYYVQRVL